MYCIYIIFTLPSDPTILPVPWSLVEIHEHLLFNCYCYIHTYVSINKCNLHSPLSIGHMYVCKVYYLGLESLSGFKYLEKTD